MATQAVEALESGEAVDTTLQPEEYESKAKAQGWTPQDQFKGDPNKWVDAETFVKRSEESLPLLKKELQHERNARKTVERDLRSVIARFEGVEKRAMEKAMAEIEARAEAAADVGDSAGVKAALGEMKELQKEATAAKPIATKEEADIAAIEWREQNPWYDSDPLARDYADLVSRQNSHMTATMLPADYFAFVAEKVRERYGARLDAANDETPAKRRGSAVEGQSQRRARGDGVLRGVDLDPEAKRQGERFIKQGLFKNLDEYAKELRL